AASLIEERGAQADRAGRNPLGEAQLALERDLLDRPGRADLAAQRAVELAEADREIHDRCPQTLEAALGEGRGLQHVGRADVDALVALDAALEELDLGDCTRRADRFGAEATPV